MGNFELQRLGNYTFLPAIISSIIIFFVILNQMPSICIIMWQVTKSAAAAAVTFEGHVAVCAVIELQL